MMLYVYLILVILNVVVVAVFLAMLGSIGLDMGHFMVLCLGVMFFTVVPGICFLQSFVDRFRDEPD